MRGRPGPTWKISVNVPREKAYAYVADVGRHGEWGSAADSMTITADQPGDPAVGKTYSATGILLGKPNTSKVTITALEPPERVEFEYEDSRGTGGHVFTFTPEGGGTLITRSPARSTASSSRCSGRSSSSSSSGRSTSTTTAR